ncbi:hypothetical protein NDU88_000015 [Pleurodeles waltl]|uniref:Uncharacterized protein n=1 Tax=Pleurodeles waltl TaxID=8319 RepID=A0AAV7WI42_PLEWA|nr:hypothetical protein NDU88_000015 [Pleurodeles waltl]
MPHALGPHPKTIKAPGWRRGNGSRGWASSISLSRCSSSCQQRPASLQWGSVGLLHRQFSWASGGSPVGAGPLFLGRGGVASSNPWDFAPQCSPGFPVRPPSGGSPRSLPVDRLCVGTPGPPSRRRDSPPSRRRPLSPYFRSGGAPRVPHSDAPARAPRGGPANVGPFSRVGTGPSLPSTGLHTRSTTQHSPGPAGRPQPGAAASVRATASEPNQPRRPRPSRHFFFLSPRSRSGRGGRSEPAFRHRSPPPAPRDPGITGRVEAASLARQNRVSYGRMTEGSRALSECDRHLDARSHAISARM